MNSNKNAKYNVDSDRHHGDSSCLASEVFLTTKPAVLAP